MSNPSKNKRPAPSGNDTPTAKRHKRRQAAREQATYSQQSATSAATSSNASRRRKKKARRRPRPRGGMAPRRMLPSDSVRARFPGDAIGGVIRSRRLDDTLPALVERDDGPLRSRPNLTTRRVRQPENEQDRNLVPPNMEARSPTYPSFHNSNPHQGTHRLQEISQVFSEAPVQASSHEDSFFSIIERAKTKMSAATSNQAQETPADLSAVGEWRVVHEAGYCPALSLSYVPPMKKDVGVFPSRWAAVQYGQQLVGSAGGYTWGQVRDSGDLEIVAATSSRWEIYWRPPDSEYSRVTATLLAPGAGRWVVDVERGYVPDGVRSYVAPTKNTLGPFQSREIAVATAKKEVGGKRGMSWVEVVRGSDFENREDSANRWDGYWEPPDSEYSHVIAKLLVPAVSADSGNGTNLKGGDSCNDDQKPTSSDTGLKQTARESSGHELPLAF